MYSDQISTGRKRSIHERLDGDLPTGAGGGGRARHAASKRSVRGAAPLPILCSAPRLLLRLRFPTSLVALVVGVSRLEICPAVGFSVPCLFCSLEALIFIIGMSPYINLV
jgi:hypothetical protein